MLESKNKLNPTEHVESFVGTTKEGGNPAHIRKGRAFLHGFIISLGMFSFGVLIGIFNPIAVVFKFLQGWSDDDNTLYVSLVTTAGNFGAMCGAFMAPLLVRHGKRKLILEFNILFMATCAV